MGRPLNSCTPNAGTPGDGCTATRATTTSNQKLSTWRTRMRAAALVLLLACVGEVSAQTTRKWPDGQSDTAKCALCTYYWPYIKKGVELANNKQKREYFLTRNDQWTRTQRRNCEAAVQFLKETGVDGADVGKCNVIFNNIGKTSVTPQCWDQQDPRGFCGCFVSGRPSAPDGTPRECPESQQGPDPAASAGQNNKAPVKRPSPPRKWTSREERYCAACDSVFYDIFIHGINAQPDENGRVNPQRKRYFLENTGLQKFIEAGCLANQHEDASCRTIAGYAVDKQRIAQCWMKDDRADFCGCLVQGRPGRECPVQQLEDESPMQEEEQEVSLPVEDGNAKLRGPNGP